MEYIMLKKDDFVSEKGKERFVPRPRLHVKYSGLFCINRDGVTQLGLKKDSGVSFCTEKSSNNCFAVLRDDASGWKTRPAVCGSVVFNNVKLARHIIDSTWGKVFHSAGEVKPLSLTFNIATLPVDEDKNKNVFALIEKKE